MMQTQHCVGIDMTVLLHTETWRCHLEPKMVLQSDAIEEPFLVPPRTFPLKSSSKNLERCHKEP